MSIYASGTIRTRPEPTIFGFLYSIQKEFAYLGRKSIKLIERSCRPMISRRNSNNKSIRKTNSKLYRTHNVCGRFLFLINSVLLLNYFCKLLFIPILHSIIFFTIITHVKIERSFFSLTFQRKVMRKFTFVSFCTLSLLKKCT